MLEIIKDFSVIDLIDITIISFVIYRLLLLIKGTRAFYMFFGIVFLVVFSFVARYFGLKTTSWMLSNFSGYLFLTIIILFQPEIRRALAAIGETGVFGNFVEKRAAVIDEVVKACTILANRQIGALIVIERKTDLTHYVQTLQKIDSIVSKELLLSIFIPYSPLHDGAVIIKEDRMVYAGAILPLSKREDLDKSFGTRHRAAIGITEETDAVSVVVSEERGTIAVAANGRISTELDAEMLRNALKTLLGMESKNVS
ncbi:diadenylate cyclase CdaA [Deferribacter abyssi]|uniref:diadenylate cyclase CdaA n=1 Tax=Deferribacter abyssi TaxID=213806 RepID=UPI003C143557